MNNKRGWIRVVEAFVAILLITGVLLVVINKGYILKKDDSPKIYDAQISILREIELNDQLRTDILNIDSSELPVKWGNPKFPSEVNNTIITRTPSYLECIANICNLQDICGMEKYVEKDVYAQAVVIAANLENYKPRQIKMFCWVK